MSTMISIIEKPCNATSGIEANFKEIVFEIIRRNHLKNQQLIFKIKKPRVSVFMDNNNTDNKSEDNTINNKVPV